jgi:hypothetical protein
LAKMQMPRQQLRRSKRTGLPNPATYRVVPSPIHNVLRETNISIRESPVHPQTSSNAQVERRAVPLSRPKVIYVDSSTFRDLERSYTACPLQRIVRTIGRAIHCCGNGERPITKLDVPILLSCPTGTVTLRIVDSYVMTVLPSNARRVARRVRRLHIEHHR